MTNSNSICSEICGFYNTITTRNLIKGNLILCDIDILDVKNFNWVFKRKNPIKFSHQSQDQSDPSIDFSMIVFFTFFVQWGAVPSLIISIAFSLWLGFSPKPPPDRQLEFSTRDCSGFGGIMRNSSVPDENVIDGDERSVEHWNNFLASVSNNFHWIFIFSYFYLNRVSYMYSAFIGFTITFVIGYLLSILLRILKKPGKQLIFMDASKTTINPDLFLPPKAHFIKLRNEKFETSKSWNKFVLY